MEHPITGLELPCPFCGQLPDIIFESNDEPVFYNVCCTRHQVGGPLGISKKQAIELWNKRS